MKTPIRQKEFHRMIKDKRSTFEKKCRFITKAKASKGQKIRGDVYWRKGQSVTHSAAVLMPPGSHPHPTGLLLLMDFLN
ncbi:hypothetical protein CEXT_634551 [Caerostris extrusa]|uniref:Uncharacterized protein n=1 Tax=Caerostris extrusa TaxID=172846 RepID=A0AAV4U6H6_CAEEX|nr:hypothetical protein CEXT_634551 [Caerostris extrusa]